MTWSHTSSQATNERRIVPIYTTPGVTSTDLTAWKPADFTPKFVQSVSFVDLSGVSFTKGT
jgi:hypothetical protein